MPVVDEIATQKCANGVTLKVPVPGSELPTEFGTVIVKRIFDYAASMRERPPEDKAEVRAKVEFYLGNTNDYFDCLVVSKDNPRDAWYMDWLEIQEALKHPWFLSAAEQLKDARRRAEVALDLIQTGQHGAMAEAVKELEKIAS